MAALAVALTLTACASVDEPEARRVASDYARLATVNPGEACSLPAPRTLQQVTQDGDGDCANGVQQISFARYVASSSFLVDLVENWQSEYLQFTLYILLTIWLVQRGSSESKTPGETGRESDEQQLVGR